MLRKITKNRESFITFEKKTMNIIKKIFISSLTRPQYKWRDQDHPTWQWSCYLCVNVRERSGILYFHELHDSPPIYSCMFKILTLRYNTNIWRNLPNAIKLLPDRRWLLPYQLLIQIYYCCTGTCPAGPNSLTRVAFRSSGLQLCHIIWKVKHSIFTLSRFNLLLF